MLHGSQLASALFYTQTSIYSSNSHIQVEEVAESRVQRNLSESSRWRYRNYFTFIEVKGQNMYGECTLCPGWRLWCNPENNNRFKPDQLPEILSWISFGLKYLFLNFWFWCDKILPMQYIFKVKTTSGIFH